MNKIKFFLNKLSALPFIFSIGKFGYLYLSYSPDSHRYFDEYKEFNFLYKKFIKLNKKNNLGDLSRLWSFIININCVLEAKCDGDFAD
jgi:hypothetical protein